MQVRGTAAMTVGSCLVAGLPMIDGGGGAMGSYNMHDDTANARGRHPGEKWNRQSGEMEAVSLFLKRVRFAWRHFGKDAPIASGRCRDGIREVLALASGEKLRAPPGLEQIIKVPQVQNVDPQIQSYERAVSVPATTVHYDIAVDDTASDEEEFGGVKSRLQELEQRMRNLVMAISRCPILGCSVSTEEALVRNEEIGGDTELYSKIATTEKAIVRNEENGGDTELYSKVVTEKALVRNEENGGDSELYSKIATEKALVRNEENGGDTELYSKIATEEAPVRNPEDGGDMELYSKVATEKAQARSPEDGGDTKLYGKRATEEAQERNEEKYESQLRMWELREQLVREVESCKDEGPFPLERRVLFEKAARAKAELLMQLRRESRKDVETAKAEGKVSLRSASVDWLKVERKVDELAFVMQWQLPADDKELRAKMTNVDFKKKPHKLTELMDEVEAAHPWTRQLANSMLDLEECLDS